ncbi:toll/interleukin-1 receptor domain-containing protein [Modestobacter sp. VKM Ac-2984]|uniref:toll/interleukin-1 receptor domain-containing protein n=1 Tax=Modestobacter sp. VKM Ac-2984 TaxID=3004138 RepID=UPI0022AA3E6D|nr:toll/interleukin-1 receptor domain-containing protein [Modestobacter sp. VKM Ac-2984]MCZ2815239.1 toll/interleukin-1 receptor domain-containing protein [Modestobacter sp. VKM Ac-2984]
MNVFLSWSGSKSKDVARALRQWLPNVIQGIREPWMSDRDLAAGVKWDKSITEALDATDIGIICVTRENQEKVWLNFEAGAISRSVEDREGRVIPLLIDFAEPTDLKGPLSTFQAVQADRAGIESVLTAIDALSTSPLGEIRLAATLEVWWPRLEDELKGIANSHAVADSADVPAERDPEDMLREVLSLVRGLTRQVPGGAAAPELTSGRELRDSVDRLANVVWEILGEDRVSSVGVDAVKLVVRIKTRDYAYDDEKEAVRVALRHFGYQAIFDVSPSVDEEVGTRRSEYSTARSMAIVKDLEPGSRIHHDTFGEGSVVDIAGAGTKTSLTVDFDKVGTKRLIARYAPIALIR